MRSCPNCTETRNVLFCIEGDFRIVTCTGCGLTYLQNPPTDGMIYEEYYRDLPLQASEELAAIIAQRIALLQRRIPQGSLLDIGCGQGFFLAEALRIGYRAQGIDVSAAAVAFAKNTLHVEASITSIDELLCRETRFDIITLWHVLEHTLDPNRLLAEVYRILKPGGLFIVAVPNLDNFVYQFFYLLAPGGYCFIEVPNLHSMKFILSGKKWIGGNHPLYHRTFFTSTTLEETMRKSGFRDIERIPISYVIPGQHRVYSHLKRVANTFAVDAFLDYVARG